MATLSYLRLEGPVLMPRAEVDGIVDIEIETVFVIGLPETVNGAT